MPVRPDIDGQHPIEHATRARNGIDAHPGRAAVGGLAAHGDGHVDAALVGERDAAVRADHDDHQLRAVAKRAVDADRRVMAPGFPCRAHGENQPPAQTEPVGRRLDRRKRGGQRSLLLGNAAAADMDARRILDQLSIEGIAHAIGRMRHGIGDEHQAWLRAFGAELDQHIAHLISPRRQRQLLQQRNHRRADEALHLRLMLEALGLWAGMAHEGARPCNEIGCRDA